MATLEVHDGQGRVQRVEISRHQTVLFGSSPKCDIVLQGEGVLPFHGRLRWKSTRYKVDASPDAEALVINGRRLAASSFRQGDEIEIGPCRIFMIYADEDEPPQDDKTRVQPAPFAAAPATPKATAPRSRRESPLEQNDWLDMLETAPPSEETPVATIEAPAPRGRRDGRQTSTGRDGPSSKSRLRHWLQRFFSVQTAPGEERILTSPLVIGLAVSVVVLVALGFALNTIIASTVTTRLFQRAVDHLDDGDYRNAIRRFDEFLARKSGDTTKEGKARVLRALANVRQYTSTTGASWSNALEAEQAMLEQVAGEPAYRDASVELAELVLKTGESLADRAKSTASPKILGEAEAALALHARVAGEAAGPQLGRSRLPAKLQDARAAVRKAAVRAQALAAMDAGLQAGSARDVYQARDALIRQYADLAADRDLVARLTRANDLIRRAVVFDPSRRPAETAPPPDPLGPAASLVLRSKSKKEEPGPANAQDTQVFALADGMAYGLSGDAGAPLWQAPVGLSSPFPPQAIPGGNSVLAFDARHDELVRLDARTGALIWRQALGGPIHDPPLVLGNQIVQPAPHGDVFLIDLNSGELRGTIKLGLPLTRSPVSDESGQFLYQLANQDCLFVLRRDPIACEAVEYLGHAAGALPCTPARLGRFLVIPENLGLNEGRWRVCVLDADGAKVRQGQSTPVPGWTWSTPAAAGSIIWATADRAGVAAYSIGDYDDPAPLRLLSQLTADAKPSGPAFAFARSERELWLSGARPGRYDLTLEKGTLAKAWSLAGVGPAAAPLQLAGSNVVMTHQFSERPGVALWGLDPQSGQVRWQTVLGSPWPAPLVASSRGDELTTLGIDGRTLRLPESRLRSGGFLESTLPGPGEFRLPTDAARRLEGDGLTILVPSPHARQLVVQNDDGPFQPVDLPAALGAAPLLWGDGVLIPGDDGRVYLVDPRSGESKAEPYVPTFDRTRTTVWRAPVRLNDDAVALVDDSGRVRRLTLVQDPRPRLTATAEVALGSGLLADPTSTGSALLLATDDGRIRALAGRDLSPIGAWPVEAPLTAPPAAVGDFAFASDQAGGVTAFGADGQRLWSTSLRASTAIGPPALLSDAAWFLTRDGSLHRLALSDGSSLDRIELNVLPAGDLQAVGSDLVVPVANGTVRPLTLQNPTGVKAANHP